MRSRWLGAIEQKPAKPRLKKRDLEERAADVTDKEREEIAEMLEKMASAPKSTLSSTRMERQFEFLPIASSAACDIDIQDDDFHTLVTALNEGKLEIVNQLLFQCRVKSKLWRKYSLWFRTAFGDYVFRGSEVTLRVPITKF